MRSFKNAHPLTGFLYFTAITVFSAFSPHPLFTCISFEGAFLYSVVLKGRKAVKFNLTFLIPMMLFTAMINPLFSHKGATVLGYFPSGNPLTAESVFYGIGAAGIFGTVICWFSCFNEVMTDEKIVYLFGKLSPTVSLLLCMTFRFVPRIKEQAKKIYSANKALFCENSVKAKIKNAGDTLSAVTSWALENSVEMSDSMKSRGYGLKGRTAFSLFKFTKDDTILTSLTLVISAFCIFSAVKGYIYFSYYPTIYAESSGLIGFMSVLSYALLCFLPCICEISEAIKWKA